jgi:hypothetical protein
MRLLLPRLLSLLIDPCLFFLPGGATAEALSPRRDWEHRQEGVGKPSPQSDGVVGHERRRDGRCAHQERVMEQMRPAEPPARVLLEEAAEKGAEVRRDGRRPRDVGGDDHRHERIDVVGVKRRLARVELI